MGGTLSSGRCQTLQCPTTTDVLWCPPIFDTTYGVTWTGGRCPASNFQAGLGYSFLTRTLSLWLNQPMFARKIRVEYEDNGQRHPCPMKWLDNFSMRNFTNASVFDDTLPLADGLMEIGTRVPLVELKDAMEDWFRRKSYLPKGTVLVVSENEVDRTQQPRTSD